MEQIFRGYPQALCAMEAAPAGETKTEKLQPYMLYRRDSRTELSGMIPAERAAAMEEEYLQGLYPCGVKDSRILVEETVEAMDYSGSPIYDEYPDRETMYRLRDSICRQAARRGIAENRDLIQMLLVQEIGRKRQRKRS